MSLWDEGFEEPKENFPNDVVQEITDGFEVATKGRASIIIRPLSDMERLGKPTTLAKRFMYNALLTSRTIAGYSFEIMTLGYDVSLYPVIMKIEGDIGSEIGIETDFLGNNLTTFNNEEDFKEIVNKIFQTNKFRATVGGLIKIAKSQE